MIEIERKFLVKNTDFIEQATRQVRIVQGYLSSNPERTVRVRVKGDKGYITVKGKSTASGISRMEWEKEIPVAEVEQLLAICEVGVIDKVRYEVPVGNHLYEVDIFAGANEGLLLAEVELNDENEWFVKPDWLGEEVSTDERYYNAYLSSKPYKTWE